jgi:putative PIN family toxin of toxin-antitoxin system
MTSAGALRVVLDTNVLLSVYAFRDSRLAVIGEWLAAGRWRALTNPACLAEFERVIMRPQFRLDAEAASQAVRRYADVAEMVPEPAAESALLPRCKDRSDQKFLELARDGAADRLLTADRALLVLDRRQRLGGRFRIVTPDLAVSEEMTRLAPGTGEQGIEDAVRQ